ncbi:kinesin-like protein KIN-4C [Nymphaea colorata]|nr:kinesin-like protein KIN-4C [Nymphaea colorata]
MDAGSVQPPPAEKDALTSVSVAVNIRPLIPSEHLQGCTDCITVVPGEPQVQIGNHAFTFDYVFGSKGTPADSIYDHCAAPLVDALFSGYNATILAYGQTGSGKTYTMGTGHTDDTNSSRGITPKVMESIFEKIEAQKSSTEFLVRVSFIEIFKEEVLDLLDPQLSSAIRTEGLGPGKPAVHVRAPIQIRETANGGITLSGVTEAEVRSKEEMASLLAQGSLCRATGCTNMNRESSRSHAIFTITLEQKKGMSGPSVATGEDMNDEFLSAKLHLVDLAGSERAKRTGADGLRFKEGVHINRGLLALGNVISALGDEKKRKEGGHVPYRDSKLTRLLQDSLGGNSKTVMIACVSPAETNAEETLNTLKYANRARNIQNKAIVNRNPVVAEMQRMRAQLEQLQAELLLARSEGTPFEELQVLRHRISVLESNNTELRQELVETRMNCERLVQSAVDAEVEKDKLIMKIESARNRKSWDEVDGEDISAEGIDLLKNYATKVQRQEAEILHLKNLCQSKQDNAVDCFDLEDHEPSFCNGKDATFSGEAEVEEKELEHCALQDTLGRELQELDKCLQQKEAEMKLYSKSDTIVLKQHYEKKLLELEHEKKHLQREMERLRAELANISSASDESAHKLKEEYLHKLNLLEAQVAELKKKQDAQSLILRQKQKSDEAAKRLQEEIQRIKTQKVQLQHKIKQESEQFRAWKTSREKEVLQLKKEGRRNTYEMHKLLALNQRQKMVLQRKTEEAAMATKRLKELLESRKASSRETFVGGHGNMAGVQSNEKVLRDAIEHELELIAHVHEVRTEYDRQIQERARMAKEIAELKEESEMLKQDNTGNCTPTMSPGARNSRIYALENMLTATSSTLVSMASQLSEAEERERIFSGRGRWSQVRSLGDAKNLLNYLFNLVSSSRCCIMDKERRCREKDAEIKELRERISTVNSRLKQMEFQAQKHKEIQLMDKKHAFGSGTDGVPYDLRKAIRNSICFNYDGGLFDDMDTSDSELSSLSDEDWEKSAPHKQRKKARRPRLESVSSAEVESLASRNSCMDSSKEADNLVLPSSDTCCSCSQTSGCKTMKCECRASGGLCGAQCSCKLGKCANRKSCTDDATNALLATEGATLLESAMKNVEVNVEPVKQRKPLSDVGNTLANSDATQPSQRKQWKKSSFQLVPAQAPTPTPTPTAPIANQGPNSEAVKHDQGPNGEALKQDAVAGEVDEIPIPLKLPRAMRKLPKMNSDGILKERNASRADDTRPEKPSSRAASKSPLRPARSSSDEKENSSRL